MKNKNLMNKIVDSRITWMLLSLLIAFFLWSYVASQDTQEINKTFVGVPVKFVGEDVMRESRNMVILERDVGSVNITISGPRRVLSGLNAADLVAQVDVSKLTTPAYTSQTYKIIFPDGTDTHSLQITNYAPTAVNFMVSALSKKQIDVHGRFEGRVVEGYHGGEPVFEPSTITVYGAETYLKDIKDAYVVFGEDKNIDQTLSVDASFILRDKNDKEYSTANLEFSDNTVKASLPIQRVKTVPLDVTLIYGAGASEENTKVTIEPASIILSGDSELLDGINVIKLGSIDTTNFISTWEEDFPIKYADGLKNETGIIEAHVTVEISNLSTRKFTVDNIGCLNKPTGLECEISAKFIVVTLRGQENLLNDISKENIWAEIDLSDYQSTGSFVVPVKIRVDGVKAEDVGMVGMETHTVAIELKKAEE